MSGHGSDADERCRCRALQPALDRTALVEALAEDEHARRDGPVRVAQPERRGQRAGTERRDRHPDDHQAASASPGASVLQQHADRRSGRPSGSAKSTPRCRVAALRRACRPSRRARAAAAGVGRRRAASRRPDQLQRSADLAQPQQARSGGGAGPRRDRLLGDQHDPGLLHGHRGRCCSSSASRSASASTKSATASAARRDRLTLRAVPVDAARRSAGRRMANSPPASTSSPLCSGSAPSACRAVPVAQQSAIWYAPGWTSNALQSQVATTAMHRDRQHPDHGTCSAQMPRATASAWATARPARAAGRG